ncbi:MAG: hypothetical protein F4107_14360 [Gemmatimonadetes bacterium]|nr:hypothetical protein [Gemmatimonadota bacterium]
MFNSFFVGSQSHPEFKSRPAGAHPLFASFIEAGAARAAGTVAPKAAALGA